MMIRENISLKPFNTFGIDAMAKKFAAFSSVDELKELLHEGASERKLVLGGGSNILLTGDFDGLVLKNDIRGIAIESTRGDHVYITAGAGENWHGLVMYSVETGLGGLENLSLIPGNVGASPMQNIGAYGVEIKDVFEELEAVHIRDGSIRKFNLKDCRFGYRDSVFKNELRGEYVITRVTYRLQKKPVFNTGYGALSQELEKMGVTELSVRNVSQAVINIRSSKLPDPEETGNAGSFFKNPTVATGLYHDLKDRFPTMPSFPVSDTHTKIPAGWMIEQCGWKGYRKGDAGCYPKQALVLVNYGHASGHEIFGLSEEIIASVQKKFGITLEREVNVI